MVQLCCTLNTCQAIVHGNKKERKMAYIKANYGFTQEAALALRKIGVEIPRSPNGKPASFELDDDTAIKAGVRYIRGTPETSGRLVTA